MKKILIIMLCCLLLAGCAPANQDQPTQATQPNQPSQPTQSSQHIEPVIIPPVSFFLYTPNENVDGFEKREVTLGTLDAQAILELLIAEDVLNESVALNSVELQNDQLLLDFNSAYFDQLVTYGTSGELMMMGSVVNTYLDAYDAQSVVITADGEIMESGHVVYDFPLEFYH